MKTFSVLMSLYYKEKAEYFQQCMKSILNQTRMPEEIVIVKDGPLTDELENILSLYIDRDPELYTIVPLEKNMGLGPALAEGLKHCRNPLVARMDTDDLSVKRRFEIQVNAFEEDPTLDICGSAIVEFEGTPRNMVARRQVPLDDRSIKNYQRRRDAFNHMTVMYKKEAVLKAGNYQSVPLMEDTVLWVMMILAGANCKNIEKPLVYARVGKEMFDRRGGWEYWKKYREGRKRVYQTGYISKADYYLTLATQICVALIPPKAREWVFIHILHRKKRRR